MFWIIAIFKDILKPFDGLKINQKSVWSNVSLLQKYLYSGSVFSTLYIEIKHKFWNIFLWTKYTVQKLPSFFFCELQRITVLLLIWDSYMIWSTRLLSPKLCVGFSTFDSILLLLKFIFLFNKMQGLFDFKTS